MNQNNMNNQPRVITQDEIDRVNHISHEELQKTQVLNLKDVEEAARIEKRTSKKPALIVGIIGLAFLLCGSSFQIAASLKTKEQAEQIVEPRKEEVIPVESSFTCTQTKLNVNGTDSVYNFSYYFEDNKLVNETKTLSVVPTTSTTNVDGTSEITKNKEMYKKYLNQSPGYSITLDTTEKGFSVTTDIDYKKLDLTKLNTLQKDNLVTSVDYKVATSGDTIKEDMLAKKFVCQ